MKKLNHRQETSKVRRRKLQETAIIRGTGSHAAVLRANPDVVGSHVAFAVHVRLFDRAVLLLPGTAAQRQSCLGRPRRLGIALIGVEILVLVLAVAEHVQRLGKMREQGLPPDSGSRLPLGSAGAILAIGVVALVSVFLKWHL